MGKCIGFHFKIDLCIDMCCVQRNMPKPGPNGIDVHI